MTIREWPWSRWMPFAVVAGIILIMAAILVSWIQQARETAWKTQSINNLKNLGIAFHNYHDAFECLPPGGVINENDVAFHGWHTAIVPFIDANPYYDMLNFNVPWTDPENAHVFRNLFALSLIPGVKETYTTDGFALLHYLGNPNVLHRNSSVKFKDMKAGTTETWLLGEAAGNYQPWGYPFNWRPLGARLNAGPDSYGRPTEDGAFFVMADGTVTFLQNDVAPQVLKAMADAPPVAMEDRIQVPERRFEFAESGWKTTSVILEEDEFCGQFQRD